MNKETLPEADMVRPWDTLSDDEKKLFCRMAEVYAAFSEYTDVQIGRVIDYLEESGQLDNTLIFYCADNGASGEGSPNGSVNENRFFNGFPDDIKQNLAMIDRLGSPDTYNHYPTGWAVAFSTPYRMFKRYSSYAGGTCDPLVIHWPKGMKARGEMRHQYHHCTDIVPTILEGCVASFHLRDFWLCSSPHSAVEVAACLTSRAVNLSGRLSCGQYGGMWPIPFRIGSLRK
jgi:arylsulfatase A-like enzyme